MADPGIGIGIGRGLSGIAEGIRSRKDFQYADRERQADKLVEQMHAIRDNISQVGLNSPEGQNLSTQLKDVIEKHNALYPAHETPALMARIQKLFGKTPAKPQPDPRAGMTVEREMAMAKPAVPWQLDKDVPVPFKAVNGVVYTAQVNPTTGQKRWVPSAGVSPQDIQPQSMQDMRAAGLTDEEIADATRVKAGLEAKATAPKPAKPLTFSYHPQTGGLTTIGDPNNGATYDASNIASAPPEIKKRWEAIQEQQAAELKRKEDLEAKKAKENEERQQRTFEAALDRQQKALNNELDKKDYEAAKKVVTAADNDYQSALDRMATMDKNLVDGLQGNQQAMMSMIANHIGMTLSAQKGARINKAVWDEAIASAPWLETMRAKLGLDYTNETGESIGPKLLAGVKLTPEQMHQMVDLAHQKVDILKDHKRRVEDEYHDALSVGTREKKTPAELKDKAKPAEDADPLGILK